MKQLKKATLGGELLHPNDYIAALELKGKDTIYTITKVERKELKMAGGEKDMCAIVHFKETPKMLIMNKTNASSVVTMYGSEAQAWTGKRITLYPTRVPCGREMVDAIRVREKPPTGSAPKSDELDQRVPDSPEGEGSTEPTFDVSAWVSSVDEIAKDNGWDIEELQLFMRAKLAKFGKDAISDTTPVWRNRFIESLSSAAEKSERDAKRKKD